jgi:hypothetical protein
MLNNIVGFELLFTKLSGIHPYEKCIKQPGGHARRHAFMACSKLEARGHLLHKTGGAGIIKLHECTRQNLMKFAFIVIGSIFLQP